MIEFYLKKTVKNKKDKKTLSLLKGLNLIKTDNIHILERVIDLFARR